LKKGNLLCFFPESSFNVLASTPQSLSVKKLRNFPFLNALQDLASSTAGSALKNGHLL
jgi:hypothetical protein